MKIKDIFTDAYIVLVLLAIAASFICLAHDLLYPDKENGGLIRVELSENDLTYKSVVSIGDTVYDTLTKRRIGEIKELNQSEDGEKTVFSMVIYAERMPRGKALRTPYLWFECSDIVLIE